MNIYKKQTKTHLRADHFYKMYRYIWFDKFIFTVDVYPSQISFGFMIAMTSIQFKFLTLSDPTDENRGVEG